jgi:hypothetical protein
VLLGAVVKPWIVGTVAALVASASLMAPTAAAADGAVLGGGAGITVNGALCTLATIGHDKSGELVGFTAARCGGPGSPVAAAGSGAAVGSVVASDGDLYAVIKFDPAKVTPTANFAGFIINGIGPDPVFNQPACTHGAESGDTCGTIRTPTAVPGVVGAAYGAWNPGDAGEPVTVEGQLVGVTRNGANMVKFDEARTVHHTDFALFSAIMNDVNAKGGTGAGFTPIAA